MRHKLTVEQQLDGARKALAGMQASANPRIQNLVRGLRKLIANLEQKVTEGAWTSDNEPRP